MISTSESTVAMALAEFTATGGASPSSTTNATKISPSKGSKHQTDDEKELFPKLLHRIVSDPKTDDCIHWLPCGTRFIISNKDKFSKTVLPEYYGNAKFTSFTRRLKRWSFSRIPSGPFMGAYYNVSFRRDEPDKAVMVCYNHPVPQSAVAMHIHNKAQAMNMVVPRPHDAAMPVPSNTTAAPGSLESLMGLVMQQQAPPNNSMACSNSTNSVQQQQQQQQQVAQQYQQLNQLLLFQLMQNNPSALGQLGFNLPTQQPTQQTSHLSSLLGGSIGIGTTNNLNANQNVSTLLQQPFVAATSPPSSSQQLFATALAQLTNQQQQPQPVQMQVPPVLTQQNQQWNANLTATTTPQTTSLPPDIISTLLGASSQNAASPNPKPHLLKKSSSSLSSSGCSQEHVANIKQSANVSMSTTASSAPGPINAILADYLKHNGNTMAL